MAIEYTPTAGERARARARRAAAAADVSLLRRLDWLLLAGVVALVAYGLWAINGITHHDVESSPHYFLTPQLAFVAGGFLAERVRRINDVRTTLSAIGLAALPITLVFMQPDFGTALVYGAALAAVLFIAGTRWLTMAFLAGAVLVGAVLILWALPAAG